MPPRVALRTRLQHLLLDKRVWVLAILAGLGGTYPFSCGALGGRLVTSKLAVKLGVPVECGKARAGWGVLRISNLTVGPKDRPILSIAQAVISLSAAWGSGTVILSSPYVDVHRGGDGDNAHALLERLRKPSGRGARV